MNHTPQRRLYLWPVPAVLLPSSMPALTASSKRLSRASISPRSTAPTTASRACLDDRLLIMDEEDPKELERLLYTPSSALGSCRYKIADPDVDDTDYKRILEIFKKYDVRYFFYNGGNDSMDTCNKISKYMAKVGYDCRVIGVPKTIDNDLFGTDHCPALPPLPSISPLPSWKCIATAMSMTPA